MCAIVGAFHSGGRLPDLETFTRCVQRLNRRGPDDHGIWSDPFVRLGHRRLAVVDLSPAGHQPMASSDDRFVITFNGEIYNHAELRSQLTPIGGRWKGSSDTETLLEAYRAWGTSCLQRLQGMFAFGIWDKVERKLFVARDRLGVKPLYYAWRDGMFAFGSRPGAVVPLAGSTTQDINPQALRVYLELGYIPAPLSFYQDVHKLRPAHYILIDEHGPRVARYWDYRHISPDLSLLKRDENEIIDELDELIKRAVHARLMSDVPLGAFLSGGVDSAMVVAAMKAAGVAAPRAFTIAFNERQYNEGPAAARIARHLQVDHVIETLNVSDLLALLPAYVEEFDEPFADSSSFPTMAVARLARRHVTVALSGDGGDELFGGYHYYSLIERLSHANRMPERAKHLLRGVLGGLPWHNAKLAAGALQFSNTVEIFNYLRGCGKDFGSLVNSTVLQTTCPSSSWFEQFAASFAVDLTNAELGMRLDLGFMLSDGYLQKVDVATMAFSLEARCPMTDYRLVEWAMRLPARYKIRGRETKYLLKRVLCRYLPAELVYQPKRGFGVPIAQWLRGPLRGWAESLIYDTNVMSRLPIERTRIENLFQLHVSGKRDAHPVLWATLMLLCYVARHDCGMELPVLAGKRAA
jgi:asparagine synthase (glutamine-hydrolysing)